MFGEHVVRNKLRMFKKPSQDAGEGDAGKLVDELDADEHDGAHDDEEDGAVHTKVVELYEVVGDVRPEKAHGRPDEICL